MTEDWAAVAADVAAGLMEAGAPAAIITHAYDPDRPPYDPGPPIPTPHPVTAVVVDYTERERTQTPSIQVGDKKALVQAGVIVPDTSMLFRWQGVDHQIMNIQTTAPAGVAVLYELRVRRG